LEAFEITELQFGLSFQILAGFSTFLNHFLTQIHTLQSAFKEERNERSVSGISICSPRDAELLAGLAPFLSHGHAVNTLTIECRGETCIV